MKDSGKRQEFKSGAVRDITEGKSRPDLISPFAQDRLGKWLAEGAKKYAPRNWEKGIPLARTLESLCRHINAYQRGDDSEDHLAAVMCNAMFLAHGEEMISRGVWPVELDDLPDYRAEADKQ
jgi:hypothetical protein